MREEVRIMNLLEVIRDIVVIVTAVVTATHTLRKEIRETREQQHPDTDD